MRPSVYEFRGDAEDEPETIMRSFESRLYVAAWLISNDLGDFLAVDEDMHSHRSVGIEPVERPPRQRIFLEAIEITDERAVDGGSWHNLSFVSAGSNTWVSRYRQKCRSSRPLAR